MPEALSAEAEVFQASEPVTAPTADCEEEGWLVVGCVCEEVGDAYLCGAFDVLGVAADEGGLLLVGGHVVCVCVFLVEVWGGGGGDI